VKTRELEGEARTLRAELVATLQALTPSRDASEEEARVLESAKTFTAAVESEMARRCSGAAFGELVRLMVVDEEKLEEEVRKIWGVVAPMSIKASDKVKKVLVHVLKWWTADVAARMRVSEVAVPQALADQFVREVCTSRLLLPVIGTAIFPYFSRSTVDTALIARILHVKVSDAMLHLFGERDRATPSPPLRLSFSEVIDEGGASGAASGIDWSDVSFEEGEADAAKASAVEIVFAGSRAFQHWSRSLGAFYLKNRGSTPKPQGNDPRIERLLGVLRDVEKVHVGAPA
jgi:hypothetical protein